MGAKKDSPNRRKSIAVSNQNRPTVIPRAKRRPHSIVAGDRLSPFAKARRSLAPRKSILKAFTNILYTDDTQVDVQSQSQSQSQPQSQVQSQPSASTHDDNATQSMDITQDFHTKIHDNTTRKSFGGRRVSFAEHVRVRLIEGASKDGNTNGSQSPQSSPVAETSSAGHPRAVTDENTYPGAASRGRRSSGRHSLANSEGEDMDLTSVAPSAILATQAAGSAVAEEEFDYDGDEYDDDMDVTEVVNGDFIRKRSLSIGVRRPLAQIAQTAEQKHLPSDDIDESRSFTEEESRSQSDSDTGHSQAMEFTMPLSRSLRPPAHHDEAWLALRRATHSGDTPIEPELSSDDYDQGNMISGDGMDLDDAVQRLMRARESLPSAQPIQHNGGYNADYDDTFSSTEDSFGDEPDNADRTMNVSRVLGRVSLGGAENTRMSMAYEKSTMDESEIYGAIVLPSQPTSSGSLAHPEPQPQPTVVALPESQSTRLPVFQPPPSTSETSSVPAPSGHLRRQQPTAPIPFSTNPKAPPSPAKSKTGVSAPISPSKSKATPKFSAAFAPPVVRSTPKKTTAVVSASPNKRPRPVDDEGSDIENIDIDEPSPAKRLAVTGKRLFMSSGANVDVPSSAPSPKPKPLSPSKKAPFQVPTVPTTAPHSSSSLRRPSGYFARRKSLGVGLKDKFAEDDEAFSTVARSSPKKKSGLGLGRASMGSGPANVRTRFDKDIVSGASNVMGKEDNVEGREERTQRCAREASREATAIPSPTRGSPAPTSPRPNSPASKRDPVNRSGPSSPVPVLDISSLFGPEGVGEQDMDEELDADPTAQWRDRVEPSEFADDDGPLISIEQFFSLTGIKFMDELTAPRRSMHQLQQSSRQARNPEEIPLADYVTAIGIEVPQLVLYSRVSKDLQAWIEKSRADFSQAEDEAAKITPELFIEYSRADEEGQAELLHQLQLIRTNTRGLAKSDWYDWKLQWLEGLRVTADKTFKSLEEDAKILEGIRATVDEVVPALKLEYDEILQELEKEQAEVVEIEASDQEYLNELKVSIAEQNIEVEALQAEVAEGNTQLLWLQERLQEVESQKHEATLAIADARSVLHIQKSGTRAEVFRLKDELEALENLHMFRATKVDAELIEYEYASQFHVSIPCKDFVPIASHVDVSGVDKQCDKFKDDFPRLSKFFLATAKQQIAQGEGLTARQIVHRLSDYWSSCTQLRSQLKLLTIKYPVEIELSHDASSAFQAKVMVLFPSVKAKAFISFLFAAETFCYWPMAIGTLRCEVHVAYGPLDRETIIKAITNRLNQASAAENYACLLDACIEAQDIYH